MKLSTRSCLSWSLSLGALLLGGAGPASSQEAVTSDAIAACLERTLPSKSAIQTVELEMADSEGSINRSRAKIHWKRMSGDSIAVLLRFSEPPRRNGMAMLARQKKGGKPETFIYLPELRQVRRVAARNAAGSMFGTDFGYEDFAFLQGVAEDDDPVVLDDREISGRAAYALQSRVAIAEEPTYERILYFVERERCTPLGAEFYEPGGKLRKVLEVDVDSIQAVGDRFVPMLTTMRDLETGTATKVTVIEIEPDVEIRDRAFSPGELQVRAR